MEETTEPEGLALPEVEDVPVVDEDAEEATEADDSDNPDGEPEDEADDSEGSELVEVEINGKVHTIPAELRDEFMLRADYTRKTQELAEQRRTLESRLTEVTQISEAELGAKAQIFALDAALQQYEGVDWDLLDQQDPVSANRHFRNYTLLQQQRQAAEHELIGASQKREAEMQRATAEQFQQSMAVLQKEIPEWGEAKAVELARFAQTHFGFTDAEFRDSLVDPRAIKMLNLAYAAVKSSTKPKRPAPPPPKPATKVKGGSLPKKGLDDRLSADEWIKQRSAQVANRR